jgi:site-specific recombinase XerD
LLGLRLSPLRSQRSLHTAAPPAASYRLDLERAAALAREEKAKSTRRVYRIDFQIFSDWCAGRGVNALPASPESVAAFLAAEIERGIKPSTLGHRVAALRHAHKLAGFARRPTMKS